MATSKVAYASTGTAITITLPSLADGAYRESTAITNAANLYIDALVGASIQVGAVGADGTIEVYAYASADGGTTYSGGLDGSDAAVTWGTTHSTSVNGFSQLVLLGVIDVDTTDDNNDLECGPYSIASAFGGVLPEDWGLVIKNDTGTAFHATGTNNSVHYSGIQYTSS